MDFLVPFRSVLFRVPITLGHSGSSMGTPNQGTLGTNFERKGARGVAPYQFMLSHAEKAHPDAAQEIP